MQRVAARIKPSLPISLLRFFRRLNLLNVFERIGDKFTHARVRFVKVGAPFVPSARSVNAVVDPLIIRNPFKKEGGSLQKF